MERSLNLATLVLLLVVVMFHDIIDCEKKNVLVPVFFL